MHLAVLAAAGFSFLSFFVFFKKQKVTPVFTAPKFTFLAFSTSHCNNNPFTFDESLQFTKHFLMHFGPVQQFWEGERAGIIVPDYR